MRMIWNSKNGEGIIYPPLDNKFFISYTKITNSNMMNQTTTKYRSYYIQSFWWLSAKQIWILDFTYKLLHSPTHLSFRLIQQKKTKKIVHVYRMIIQQYLALVVDYHRNALADCDISSRRVTSHIKLYYKTWTKAGAWDLLLYNLILAVKCFLRCTSYDDYRYISRVHLISSIFTYFINLLLHYRPKVL